MTILVTGANGQLGRELRIVAEDRDSRYVFTDIAPAPGLETVILDITDFDAVRAAVSGYDVDVVVNCAAYTDVDKAESDVTACRMLNAKAPEYLALAVKEKGGLLVHVSTDYVFGGDASSPYSEDMPCAPKSVYGLTKLEGEAAVRATGCRHIILRTSWLYSEFGHNFLKTMLKLTSSRSHLNVVSDQLGSPTYALDLAKVISSTVEGGLAEGKDGIYHYSNEGECTWYEFASEIAELSGHTDCVISPCTSEEFPSPVRRPAYSVLDKSRIKEVLGIEVPHWKESLKNCLKNFE